MLSAKLSSILDPLVLSHRVINGFGGGGPGIIIFKFKFRATMTARAQCAQMDTTGSEPFTIVSIS
jgi:hypothetical protein